MCFRSSRQLTPIRPLLITGLILLAAPLAYGQTGLVAPPGVEVTPMSVTLDESASVKRFTPYDPPDLGKAADPRAKFHAPGWTTIAFEGGGDFPAFNGWTVFDNDAASGADFWDDVMCRPFSGNWSIWCADIPNADCSTYDNDMNSWMIFGPFSLADAVDARAEFFAWSEVEDTFDSLFVGASVNGTSFFGGSLSEDFGWSGFFYDFTSVPTLGNLAGAPAVWLAFVFTSDASVAIDEGVYLDDIVVEKLTNGGCTSNATTLCLPASDRFRVSLFFFTSQGAGNSGDAQAIPLDSLGTSSGGLFYFVNPTDPQFLVKVVNGCAVNNRWWVFYAATTNVGFDLTVTDTVAGQTKVYSNPDINPAPPIQDTQAFATCP